MLIIPHDLTIAVADGTKMRLFRNKAAEPHVELVELPSPHIHGSNHGAGGHHTSSSANPDASRKTEDNFAAAAGDYLSKQVLEGAIGSLFIVADPRTLGELRRHLHASVASKLVGELHKDLTGHSLRDIQTALTKH